LKQMAKGLAVIGDQDFHGSPGDCKMAKDVARDGWLSEFSHCASCIDYMLRQVARKPFHPRLFGNQQ
jgi:hypothetical protein